MIQHPAAWRRESMAICHKLQQKQRIALPCDDKSSTTKKLLGSEMPESCVFGGGRGSFLEEQFSTCSTLTQVHKVVVSAPLEETPGLMFTQGVAQHHMLLWRATNISCCSDECMYRFDEWHCFHLALVCFVWIEIEHQKADGTGRAPEQTQKAKNFKLKQRSLKVWQDGVFWWHTDSHSCYSSGHLVSVTESQENNCVVAF